MISRTNISDECYDFRIRHNMTQDELAKLTGLCRATINYIECGRREPARYTAARMRMTMKQYDERENAQ